MAHPELLDGVWMFLCKLVIFRVAADPENGARCGVIFFNNDPGSLHCIVYLSFAGREGSPHSKCPEIGLDAPSANVKGAVAKNRVENFSSIGKSKGPLLKPS